MGLTYNPLVFSGLVPNLGSGSGTILVYQGLWNPATNTPTLQDSTGTNGFVYQVSTAFAGPIAGLNDVTMVNFQIGNLIIFSSLVGRWEQTTPAAGVQSVNGQQGNVTVNAINQLTGDVTAGPAVGSQSKVATVANVGGATAANVALSSGYFSGNSAILPVAHGGTNSSTALSGNKAIVSNSTQIIESSTTSAEIGFVSGVTSSIQTQINGLVNKTLSNLTSPTAVNQTLIPVAGYNVVQAMPVTSPGFSLIDSQFAAQYIPGSSFNLGKVGFALKKNAATTGTLTAYVYNNSAGQPGSVLATSQSIAVSSLAAGPVEVDFTFSPAFPLTSSTTYFLALGLVSAGPYPEIEIGGSTPTFSDGPAWSSTFANHIAFSTYSLTQLDLGTFADPWHNLYVDQINIEAGGIDLNAHNITNVLDPVNPQDAATKNYVDSASSGANTSLSNLVSTAVNTNIVPDSPNTHDLGSQFDPWNNIYVNNLKDTGTITAIDVPGRLLRDSAGGAALDFSNGSILSPLKPFVFPGMNGEVATTGSSTFSLSIQTNDPAYASLAVDTDSGLLDFHTGPTSGTGISGAVLIQSGNPSGTGASGIVNLTSGASIDGVSGDVSVASGAPTGIGNSGNVTLASGPTTTGSGSSGNVAIGSGFSNGNSGSVILVSGPQNSPGTSGSITIASGSLGSNASSTSGDITIASGLANGAVSQNSGNITLNPALATGTRGQIGFIDGTEGTAGWVWTSTDTFGHGAWVAPGGGGGANTALSNLVTTSINQDLLPDSSQTRNLGSSSDLWADVWAGRVNVFSPVVGQTDALVLDSASNTNLIIKNTSFTSGLFIGNSGGATADFQINNLETTGSLFFINNGHTSFIIPTSGVPSVNNHNITDVNDPINPQDAATKNYVDTTHPTNNKELVVLSGTDITNQYVDLAHVAKTNSIDFLVKGGGVQIEGVSYDYSVSYTGGAGGNTRITFLNDLATGGLSALVAGDVVVSKYEY